MASLGPSIQYAKSHCFPRLSFRGLSRDHIVRSVIYARVVWRVTGKPALTPWCLESLIIGKFPYRHGRRWQFTYNPVFGAFATGHEDTCSRGCSGQGTRTAFIGLIWRVTLWSLERACWPTISVRAWLAWAERAEQNVTGNQHHTASHLKAIFLLVQHSTSYLGSSCSGMEPAR